MPLNLLKTYNQLLDVVALNPEQRTISLRGVFRLHIEENNNFMYNGKQIRPIKKEGQIPMDILFTHLTHVEEVIDGKKGTSRKVFEPARSIRLHWIRAHADQTTGANIDVFSYLDRVRGKDITRTYIYNKTDEYVVILEPQKSGLDYFLITAYHLNQEYGKKQIENKLKKRLAVVY